MKLNLLQVFVIVIWVEAPDPGHSLLFERTPVDVIPALLYKRNDSLHSGFTSPVLLKVTTDQGV